ncbi:MAG: peptide transporter [Eubacteriales bacterium]|nr:peptide transporter [Eubacteriales bacterium]
MRSLIRLQDYSKADINHIFQIADELQKGKYADFLKGKTIVMFFPNSSIRTRVTFEKGIYSLGGQTILFPPETLEKKEDIRDVIGYLNQWADAVVIRYGDIGMLDMVRQFSKVPVINAMTDVNHPCEMLSDLYALSKIRHDYRKDHYLFCGRKGNIGLAWKEAAEVMDLDFAQCCPKGYEMEGAAVFHHLEQAIKGKDVICTDSLPKELVKEFDPYCITKEVMRLANEGAVLNPCPPFYRGEEVSAGVIDSPYFVGYGFKKCLLEIQQAILIYSLTDGNN